MTTDIQAIIDDKLDEIIGVVKKEIPQVNQEPDYVIMRELGKYFNKPKPIFDR